MIGELARFASVGLVATLIHVSVAFAAHFGLGLESQIANFAGFFGSVTFSYFGHALVTFRVVENHQQQAVRFGMVAGLGLLLSSSITYVICKVFGGSFALAMAVVAIAIPGSTFLGSKFWVFSKDSLGADKKDWTGVALAAGVSLAYYFILEGRIINHDTAWYLIATRQWLEGAELYIDVVEVNPPLNFYLTIPAIWLADGLGLSDTNGQMLFLSLLIFFSLAWVWRILKSSGNFVSKSQIILLMACAAALTVPAIGFAAQREQIMLILVMPFLFGFIALENPDRGLPAIARASVAAVGICIKPHFVLVPLAILLVQIARTRSMRTVFSPVSLVMLGIGVAYVAIVASVHPEYMGTIVPKAMLVYGDYGFDSASVIRNINPLLLFLALLTTISAARDWRDGRGAFLAAAVLASVAIYTVQWTGYEYQAAPIQSFMIVGFVWVLVGEKTSRLSGSLAVIGLVLSGHAAFQKGFYENAAYDHLAPVVSEISDAPKIMMFSSSLWVSFPLTLEKNAEWTSRYPALWLMPGAVNGLARTDCVSERAICEDLEMILIESRTNAVQDLMDNVPNILIFDNAPPYFDSPFNYHTFLRGDPRYEAEKSKYRVHFESRRFSIWVRK